MWASGAAYEPFIGRWSRLVAREFLAWLAIPPQRRWLDVGCGTAELTRSILQLAEPGTVVGVDASEAYLAYAREHTRDSRARFTVADATALPDEGGPFDVVVAGLVLNFVPEPALALAEMQRVARPGATVGAYVWDYAGGMQMLYLFWEAAVSLDPKARDVDERSRFALCQPGALVDSFRQAGLCPVEGRAIEVPTRFANFDDYWTPFLGGQGPAPSYVAGLQPDQRTALRDRLQATLGSEPDGSILLQARAWAARGVSGQS